MRDVAGCRLVVEDVPAQDRTVAALVEAFSASAKIVDRRERPNHGYRAVHVIVKSLGKNVEVQVRTNLQHYWAEFSERVSQDLGLAIKYGGGPPLARAQLLNASKLVADIESLEARLSTGGKASPDSDAFRQFSKDLGALRESLPKALDFIQMQIASGARMIEPDNDEGHDAVSH